MKSTTITARIRIDQAIKIEETGLNVSEFLREKLDEEFGSKDYIEEKERELKDQLDKLKKLKREEKTKKTRTDGENLFLEEAKKRIRTNGLQGISETCKDYNSKFRRNVSTMEFKELVT